MPVNPLATDRYPGTPPPTRPRRIRPWHIAAGLCAWLVVAPTARELVALAIGAALIWALHPRR